MRWLKNKPKTQIHSSASDAPQESSPQIRQAESVRLPEQYFDEFEEYILQKFRVLQNSEDKQNLFHSLVRETLAKLQNTPEDQKNRYMAQAISSHTETLKNEGLPTTEAAKIAAHIPYMVYYAQTYINNETPQSTPQPNTARPILNTILRANYNSEAGGGDDYETKLNALSEMSGMSEAKQMILLLLYRKLTGENVQALTPEQQEKMENKINSWIPFRGSFLLKSLVYLTRNAIPSLSAAGVGLAATTLSVGVLPHAALAIFAYILADIGAGALTHKTLYELKLISGAKHALNQFDRRGFLPPEKRSWLQSIFKYMRSDIGAEAPRRHRDSITLGQLRDLIESGEFAELRRQKYLHIFSRISFGVGLVGLHLYKFGDSWSSMISAWLENLNAPTSQTTTPPDNTGWQPPSWAEFWGRINSHTMPGTSVADPQCTPELTDFGVDANKKLHTPSMGGSVKDIINHIWPPQH